MLAHPSTRPRQRVLISGGGIAGLTLAYWLIQGGHQPVIVERAPHLRTEGYAIDFSGSGWDVAERMGIIPELQRRALTMETFIFKDRAGNTLATLPIGTLRRSFQGKFLTIMRHTLEQVLHQSLRDTVAVRFGTTIQHIEPLEHGVAVTYSDGSEENFDLVVGADGLHSHVRQLVFGDERQFATYLGYYAAAFPVPNLDHFGNSFVTLVEQDRQVGVFPTGDGGYCALLVYRSPNMGAIPPAERKATLLHHYERTGWVVSALIESISVDTPIYLDTVTQICMPRWSSGRVTLVGDAAHCLTLISGQGAATAMGGAYILAEELNTVADVSAACAAYERRVRPFVLDKQRKARRFARTFVPHSALGVQINYLLMRLLFTPWLGRFIGKQLGIDSLLRNS